MLNHALLFSLLGWLQAVILLFLLGRRQRRASLLMAWVLLILLAGGAIWMGGLLGVPIGEAILFGGLTLGVSLALFPLLPSWNALGRVAWLFTLTTSLLYLSITLLFLVFIPTSLLGTVIEIVLVAMQIASVALTLSYTHEILDVVCRRRWHHPEAQPPRLPSTDKAVSLPRWPRSAGAIPRVALHIPCHDEPVEVVEKTLHSLARLDYPIDAYQVYVIDNNTKDPALWRPLARLCHDLGFIFVHLEQWPGFKSGALNYALSLTPPETEIIGIIDADYVVDPAYLHDLVGYFADPQVAFVQTPQDYRDFGPKSTFYQRACYHAYRYFFDLSMPSRNERNAIIFGGTMGLIRLSALQEMGGWDEWCITEDAEASLRLLARGYQGRFVNHSYGRGLMPLEFEALKRQRFRWCFGGIQILRKHWAMLLPWARRGDERWDVPGLTAAQRYHYLISGLQWYSDVLSIGFTMLLLVTGGLLLAGHPIRLPIVGTTLLWLPLAFWSTSLLRTLWALRATRVCTWGEALGAIGILWSLGWIVTLACIQGILRTKGVFLRTPKVGKANLLRALRSTIIETVLGAACLGVSAASLFIWARQAGVGTPVSWWRWDTFTLGLGLFACIQGMVYVSAPLLCLLSVRTEHTAREVHRRATETDAGEGTREWRLMVGAMAAVATLAIAIVGSSLMPDTAPAPVGPVGQQALQQIVGDNPSTQPTPTSPPAQTPPLGKPTPTLGAGTPSSSAPTPTATPRPGTTPNPGATVTPPRPTPRPTRTPRP